MKNRVDIPVANALSQANVSHDACLGAKMACLVALVMSCNGKTPDTPLHIHCLKF